MKLCVASVPTPLCAVNEMGKVPLAVGVPLNTPLAVLNVTPAGSAPDTLRVGVGNPEAVTVNESAVPAVNGALFVLVIAGAWFTVSVKLCVASVPKPLWAINE